MIHNCLYTVYVLFNMPMSNLKGNPEYEDYKQWCDNYDLSNLVYDPKTQTEKVVIIGYITPPLEKRKKKNPTPLVKAILGKTTTPHNHHQTAFYHGSMIQLFKQPNPIPELNRIILTPPSATIKEKDGKIISYTVNTNPTLTLKIGNCKRQRKIFTYITNNNGKRKINNRVIKQTEKQPLTLNNLKFNRKYTYKISFKCVLCNNHQTTTIKNHNKKRQTPVCNKHVLDQPFQGFKPTQPMIITRVTKIKPDQTRKHVYPKTIYETPFF